MTKNIEIFKLENFAHLLTEASGYFGHMPKNIGIFIRYQFFVVLSAKNLSVHK